MQLLFAPLAFILRSLLLLTLALLLRSLLFSTVDLLLRFLLDLAIITNRFLMLTLLLLLLLRLHLGKTELRFVQVKLMSCGLIMAPCRMSWHNLCFQIMRLRLSMMLRLLMSRCSILALLSIN